MAQLSLLPKKCGDILGSATLEIQLSEIDLGGTRTKLVSGAAYAHFYKTRFEELLIKWRGTHLFISMG